MGSKSRIAKQIIPIIQRYIDENNIKDLPLITEEEIRDCYKGDEFKNECLALFDEAVKT